ncbi:hypothetical protein [Clostridium sp.]
MNRKRRTENEKTIGTFKIDGVCRELPLSDGVVAEQGTPEELMKSGTIYPHMVKLQSVDG